MNSAYHQSPGGDYKSEWSRNNNTRVQSVGSSGGEKPAECNIGVGVNLIVKVLRPRSTVVTLRLIRGAPLWAATIAASHFRSSSASLIFKPPTITITASFAGLDHHGATFLSSLFDPLAAVWWQFYAKVAWSAETSVQFISPPLAAPNHGISANLTVTIISPLLWLIIYFLNLERLFEKNSLILYPYLAKNKSKIVYSCFKTESFSHATLLVLLPTQTGWFSTKLWRTVTSNNFHRSWNSSHTFLP